MFVAVNFDDLPQASDFRIERRQVVFLCWVQDSNPDGLWKRISRRLNARWQTDWATEGQAKNLNSTARPYASASIQPTRPHCHLAFSPGSGDVHVCCICAQHTLTHIHTVVIVSMHRHMQNHIDHMLIDKFALSYEWIELTIFLVSVWHQRSTI